MIIPKGAHIGPTGKTYRIRLMTPMVGYSLLKSSIIIPAETGCMRSSSMAYIYRTSNMDGWMDALQLN